MASACLLQGNVRLLLASRQRSHLCTNAKLMVKGAEGKQTQMEMVLFLFWATSASVGMSWKRICFQFSANQLLSETGGSELM